MGLQSITPQARRLSISFWMALSLLIAAPLAQSQTLATAIPLLLPSAIAYDSQGDLYIAETGSHVIRKVDPAGIITTIAGTGTQGISGDNGPATAARLDSPQGLALDADNNLYIADTHNHRIRKLDLTSGVITTIAGSSPGFSGDNGPASAAQLDLPTALAVDAGNNLYIADMGNHRIREITAATGLITTVAGNGTQGFSGDNGPATAASIDSPTGMAVNSAGDLYLSDTHNHRIRRVTATGTITTIAGATMGFSGDNGPASAAMLALPHGLSIDSAGNLYIADTENHRIRRIDAVTGAMTTVAGNGTQNFSGDSGAAAAAALDSPRATTLSPAGLVTLADTTNQRVRQLDAEATPAIHTIAGLSATTTGGLLTLSAQPFIVYGTGELTATLASPEATGSILFTVLDPATATATTLGTAPLAAGIASFDTSTLAVGSYNLIAAYTGDPTHPATQSSPLSLLITPRPLVVIPNPITLLYGQPIPILTGTISGLLPRDNGSLTASFSASITASSPAGAYPISASITGTAANNYALTATPAILTINHAPTVTTISTPATSISSGTSLTLAAHVASTTTGTPTGSVVLMDGTTSLLALTSSLGNAIFTTNALTPGPHTLTIVYAGDRNFLSSTSAPALITVVSTPPDSSDFTLTPTGPVTQTIPSGGTANFNFSVQIQGATLASPVTLAATGLPGLATASFNPAYLPPGTTPDNFTLTINTPQTTALYRRSGTSSPLFALLLFPFVGMAFRPRSLRRKTRQFIIAILASVLTLCSGCGSRINIGSESTNPVSTYAITVTGTATGPTGNILRHSTIVHLSVQSVGPNL